MSTTHFRIVLDTVLDGVGRKSRFDKSWVFRWWLAGTLSVPSFDSTTYPAIDFDTYAPDGVNPTLKALSSLVDTTMNLWTGTSTHLVGRQF